MDDERKAFPLRISKGLFDQLKSWADQEMRSVNGQIEYLLREAVRRRIGREPEPGLRGSPDEPNDSQGR
ncbi:MAG: TA system antitoxin ParD family protein [Planctomycetota bacterium]|jgi:hypothetical protein|nr:hypothetical protein [Blastopirellula sp.]